jgi:penicillin-binding protein 1A
MGLIAYALVLLPFTPGNDELLKARAERPAVVLSADGTVLATYRRVNREWVALDRVARPVVDALIATEDRRFRQHAGIDWRRTFGAIAYTLGGDRQGGSTITQQLARNLYPEEVGRELSLTRKLKEILTARKIERVYTKDEILEAYLNTVPFLYNAVGIEMAARTYFGKGADRLEVAEAATLVAMLKGPSQYNPVLHPQRALARRNLVLELMARDGLIEAGQLERLARRPLGLDFERQVAPLGPAPHFSEHLRRWLVAWAGRNGYDVHADGLVVRTTLDARLQELATRAVSRQLESLQAVADVEWALPGSELLSADARDYVQRRSRIVPFAHYWKANARIVDEFIRESDSWRSPELAKLPDAQRLAHLRSDAKLMAALKADKTVLQAGFMAIDPRNGHVRAWVGSRDFTRDQFDHVAQARRQPGSTFKPFVYAAALSQGLSPNATFEDRPVEIRLPRGEIWRPTDAQAPTWERVTLREGLVHSRNTITAQVIQRVGAERVATLAHGMGVRESRLAAVPSLALGTSEVSLAEMVSAYATIANEGRYIVPVIVTQVEDADGRVLERFAREAEPVLPRATAETLLDIMRGVVDEGTATAIRTRFGIQADVAGKTGTTQDNTDGWFILMHEQLVAGAWVGFNDSRVTMRSAHWGRGANNALFVVGDFYRQAFDAKLLDVGAGEGPVRQARRSFPERLGNWFGEIFDGRAGPRRPSYAEAPRYMPDEEVFRRPHGRR